MFKDDLSNADYHAHDSYSKSQLDLVNADPYSLEWAKNTGRRSDKMAALNFGTAVHSMLLEPEKYASDYVVAPKVDKRTKAGKAEWLEFVEESQGKMVLDDEEGQKLKHIEQSVMAHAQCRDVLQAGGVAERSFFWADSETGLSLRCRPDLQIPERNILIDVKTTADLKKFHYSVDDYRYYVQDAFYCDGVSQVTGGEYEMYFLVVQTTIELGRYPVRLLKLPENATDYGRSEYRRNLRELADFLESGYAPVQELEMSRRFNDEAEESLGDVIV